MIKVSAVNEKYSWSLSDRLNYRKYLFFLWYKRELILSQIYTHTHTHCLNRFDLTGFWILEKRERERNRARSLIFILNEISEPQNFLRGWGKSGKQRRSTPFSYLDNLMRNQAYNVNVIAPERWGVACAVFCRVRLSAFLPSPWLVLGLLFSFLVAGNLLFASVDN